MTKKSRTSSGRFAKGVSGNPSGIAKVRHDDQDTPGDGILDAEGYPTEKGITHLDGWSSVLTGIGDPDTDKRLSHHFHRGRISYTDMMRLWETDDMAARAVESRGAECFREGYELMIADEGSYESLKEDVEDRLADIEADLAIETALAYEHAYGGAAILLGVNDSRKLSDPMDMNRVTSLDWLNVFEPIEIEPVSYYNDPTAANYGKPEYFQLQVAGVIGPDTPIAVKPKKKVDRPLPALTYIHESRLIKFPGIRVSKRIPSDNQISQYWGTSALVRYVDQLRDFGISWSSAGLIATDVSQPVISMKNLMLLVAKEPAKLRHRIHAMEMMKSSARALVIDAEEKYERVTTSLTGLPELLDRICQRLAAAVGIPLSILMGYSPASLGSPGSSEMTQWYNAIRALQRRKVGPILKLMAKMIMRSLRQRKLPKQFGIQWLELEHMTDAQRAEARLTQARADSLNVKAGMATPNELRFSRWRGKYSFETTINEKDEAPGIPYPPSKGAMVPGSPTEPGGPDGEPAKRGAKAAQQVALANKHSVGGYVRNNPTQKPLGKDPTQGGDNANPRENRDASGTAQDEVDYQRGKLDTLTKLNAAPDKLATIAQMLAIAEREAAACDDGTCGDDCLYSHPNADADQLSTYVAAANAGVLRANYAGMPIVVENPKGSKRSWVDTDGTPGTTKMKYDYGYIDGTFAADGDAVDVYLGPNPDAKWVYVVHQMSKASGFADYDEDKTMLGFDSANHARDAYLRQYDDDRFLGSISQMPIDAFKRRLATRPGAMISNGQYDGAVAP